MNVDTIIQRYLEVRGGLDKILAVQTSHRRGSVAMGDGTVVVIQGWRKRPDLLRIEFTVDNQTGREGWDGTRAWEDYPWRTDEPVYVGGKAELGLKRGSEFDRPIINYKAKEHIVTFDGEKFFSERPVYSLKVKLHNDGNIIYHYFDKETALLIGNETVRPIHASTVANTITEISDYREINGILYAHRHVEKQPTLTITKFFNGMR